MNRFIIVKQLDGSEHQYGESDLPLTLGAGPGSHIHVPGGDAAAFVGDSRGHLFVQAAEHSTRPIFHNDCHLTASTWLKSGDILVCESHQVSYERSGDRVIFTVSSMAETDTATSTTLKPPGQPPPEEPPEGENSEDIPVTVALKPEPSGRKKTLLSIIILAFLLLSCGVLFVLFARSLELVISPEPDTVSVSGFPPALRLGNNYLALPGTYTVTADKKGYIPYQREIQVGRVSTNRIEAELTRQPGIVNLVLEPADGVQVYLGDKLLGTTPPSRFELGAGNHQLRLSRDRYQSTTIDIDVEGLGLEQTIEARLQPDWAETTFVSEPPGARLYIDGVASGATPVTKQVSSGNRTIELKKDLYRAMTDSIEVIAGVAATHRFTLELMPGQFSIASVPSGAVVTLNNSYQGVTPLTLAVKAGENNDIRLSHPGYKTKHHRVTLGPGEEKNGHFELEQAEGVVFFTITPATAKVVINGKSYTSLQGRLVLPAVPQKIEVSAPGYKRAVRSITPSPGFSQQVTVDLVSTAAGVAADTPKTGTSKAAVTPSGQKLKLIHPSTFTMGAPRRESGRRANEREREVLLQRPFLIGEQLVSNEDYRKFDPKHNSGSFGGYSLDGGKQPVVNITWDKAVEYLNWLSDKDGLAPFYIKQGGRFTAVIPPTNGYRLPSEAEWAYSARSKGNSERQRYPWKGGFPPKTVSANIGDESAINILPRIIAGYNDGFPVSSPIGSFPPNSAGLYDLGGNVSEWCHDYYSAYTGSLSKTPDPLGPVNGTHKVIRGSSWRDASVTELRLSYRAYHKEARNNVGFRVARYP